jgi:hypothetical protein
MPWATVTGSASSRTTTASLPPSSSLVRLRSAAVAAAMALPVGIEPVKLILEASG